MRMYDFEFAPADHSGRVAIDFLTREGNIPLHISLRPTEGLIVFNTLSYLQWGSEVLAPFHFDASRSHVISIVIDDLTAQIFVDRKLLHICTTSKQIEGIVKPKTPLKELHDDLSFAGERFVFPFMTASDQKFIRRDLIPFLVSDVVSNTKGVIVDFSDTKAVAGVLLQSLFPQSQVIVRADRATLGQDRQHCIQNDCGNIECVTTADLISALESAAGAQVASLEEGEAPARLGGADSMMASATGDGVAEISESVADVHPRQAPGGLDLTLAPESMEEVDNVATHEADLPTGDAYFDPGEIPLSVAESDPGTAFETAGIEDAAAIVAEGTVGDATPRSAKVEELARQIRERGLLAVIGNELYSQANSSLRAALTPHISASSVSFCSAETEIGTALADSSLRKRPRHVRVSFTDSAWVLRRNRLGDIWNREDRLDIGVAMYNTGEFIIPCLESLLGDEREDVRVILVNDGSTDDTLQLVERTFGRHPRLEIHTKRNGGCASARNYARIVSNAAYIAFVDADDFVDPHMFPSLLDLARVSGNEIVQGGFRFYDSESGMERPSYEVEQFKNWKRMAFQDLSCFSIHADALIGGQPTIWRRVYRRDFLDCKALWFPEHIRAFDDMFFHLVSVYLARDVLSVDNLNYYYRQHPRQDIKQADERHFYELETYRLISKRAIREGWNGMEMFVPCIENTINFSLTLLRDDLVGPFLDAAAELWVLLERTFGTAVFRKEFVQNVRHGDYATLVAEKREKGRGSNLGFAAAYMDAAFMHPNIVEMARRLQRPVS